MGTTSFRLKLATTRVFTTGFSTLTWTTMVTSIPMMHSLKMGRNGTIRMATITVIIPHLPPNLIPVQMFLEHHTWMSLVALIWTAMGIQIISICSMMTPISGLTTMGMDIHPIRTTHETRVPTGVSTTSTRIPHSGAILMVMDMVTIMPMHLGHRFAPLQRTSANS